MSISAIWHLAHVITRSVRMFTYETVTGMAVASGPAGPVLAGPLYIRRIRCLVMVANKTGNGRRRFVHVYNRDR